MKLLREEDGYSYYENPDTEMLGKIKNHPKPIYFVIGFGDREEYKLKETLENGKLLVESSDGSLKTVTVEDFNEAEGEAHLESINRTFSVAKVFNKYFAPIKSGGSVVYGVTNKYLRHESFYSGVNSIFKGLQWSPNYWSTKYYNGTNVLHFEFNCYQNNGNGHMYLTQDGEVANRNYNHNFNEVKEFIPIEKAKEEFFSYFKKVPESLEFFEDIKNEYISALWFTDDYVYILWKADKWDGFEMEAWPKQTSGYFPQGESYRKITRPKKGGIMVDKNHLLETIKRKLDKYQIHEVL